METVKPVPTHTITGQLYMGDFEIFPELSLKNPIQRADIQCLKDDLTDTILSIVTTPEIGEILMEELPHGMELLGLMHRIRLLLDTLDIKQVSKNELNKFQNQNSCNHAV